MIYKTDYHMHSTFSDGKAAPEEYIFPALATDIKEIGFSEHLSLIEIKQEWCMNPSETGSYIEHIDNLKSRTPDLIVRTGLEIDYLPGKEKAIEMFLSDLDLDYRIGSVHYLGEKTVDLDPGFYKNKNFDLLFENYFKTVIAAAESGLFDIIGHCDLIRIYGYRPSFNPEPLYRKLARTFRENDVVLELNTNGRNRPLGDFYPDRSYLHIFREENVPVCVNSDAHMPARVGQYFDEAYNLLKTAGYTEMAIFSKRQKKLIPFKAGS